MRTVTTPGRSRKHCAPEQARVGRPARSRAARHREPGAAEMVFAPLAGPHARALRKHHHPESLLEASRPRRACCAAPLATRAVDRDRAHQREPSRNGIHTGSRLDSQDAPMQLHHSAVRNAIFRILSLWFGEQELSMGDGLGKEPHQRNDRTVYAYPKPGSQQGSAIRRTCPTPCSQLVAHIVG